MFKNVASKFTVFAFDSTTNLPKTGDAANITAYVSIDNGTVTVLGDTSATEMDATNAKGYYLFDAAQGETNGDKLMVSAKSATSNIVVVGAPAVIWTRPTTGWLAPTTAARTLDVSAGGEAGVDWANVGSPTTSLALTGTTIAVTQKVDVETIKTNPVVNAGTITFPTTATLASTTNITAGTITTVGTLTTYTGNTPQTGDSFARIGVAGAGLTNIDLPNQTMDIVGNITGNISGSVGSVAGAVGSVTGAVGSVTGNVGGNVTGSVGSVVGLTASNLDATVSSRLASASYTTPPTANQNADALLDRADAIETGITPRGAMKISTAGNAGKTSGMNTTTGKIRDVGDTKDVVTATLDGNGNRTATTVNVT